MPIPSRPLVLQCSHVGVQEPPLDGLPPARTVITGLQSSLQTVPRPMGAAPAPPCPAPRLHRPSERLCIWQLFATGGHRSCRRSLGVQVGVPFRKRGLNRASQSPGNGSEARAFFHWYPTHLMGSVHPSSHPHCPEKLVIAEGFGTL